MNGIISQKEVSLKEWLALEDIFAANNYNPNGGDQVIYIEGNSDSPKLMFCAPHALNHYRGNKLKVADIFTGSLCQLLAEQSNQPGLISIAPMNDDGFRSFGDDYINHIKEKTRLGAMIIDIHGMSNAHGCDICIGTGPNPSARVNNLAKKLVNNLNEYKVSINYPFNATADYTMTNFVQTNLKGDGIQIEISSKLRRPDLNEKDCAIFLERITSLLNEHV